MLSFFKKKRNQEDYKKLGEDSTVSSDELFAGDAISSVESDELVETELSIHPEWNIPEEQRYVFQFMNNDIPPLKPNQISLSGIELSKEDGGKVAVTAFVRNSLSKSIGFQKTSILLIGEDDRKYARKEFDLSDLGKLPPKSSRPWPFTFEEKDLLTPIDSIPTTGWTLAFDLSGAPKKHELDLADSWEKSLAETDKKKLEKMVASMQPPKPGEVNFLGLQANVKNDDLHVTMLIRNGSEKNLNLQQIPLVVEDATDSIVAKGGFNLEKFEVKANTSKPWTFIFPKSLLLKDSSDIDLSRWKAYPPKQS
jgi:accessory Sec system S-layer assembly protein